MEKAKYFLALILNIFGLIFSGAGLFLTGKFTFIGMFVLFLGLSLFSIQKFKQFNEKASEVIVCKIMNYIEKIQVTNEYLVSNLDFVVDCYFDTSNEYHEQIKFTDKIVKDIKLKVRKNMNI